MREAINEYFDLWKVSFKWVKKHWKGYLLVLMIIYIIEIVIFFPNYITKIKDFIVNKFKRKHKEI